MDSLTDGPPCFWRRPLNLISSNMFMKFQMLRSSFGLQIVSCRIIFNYEILGFVLS